MLTKVISGGQTGADRAGLDAAITAGLKTGGWMPKGFKAHDGSHPEFAYQYGIKEHESPEYPPRTALNVKESDGTIRFASNFVSPGEQLTAKMIRQYGKPSLSIDVRRETTTPEDVSNWIIENDIKILNIAGNSDKTSPGIGDFVQAFLLQVFTLLNQHVQPPIPRHATNQHREGYNHRAAGKNRTL